jgi:hypothetical protein
VAELEVLKLCFDYKSPFAVLGNERVAPLEQRLEQCGLRR